MFPHFSQYAWRHILINLSVLRVSLVQSDNYVNTWTCFYASFGGRICQSFLQSYIDERRQSLKCVVGTFQIPSAPGPKYSCVTVRVVWIANLHMWQLWFPVHTLPRLSISVSSSLSLSHWWLFGEAVLNPDQICLSLLCVASKAFISTAAKQR